MIPLSLSSASEFQKIFDDLALIGKKDHEHIKIIDTSEGYKPVTCKGENRGIFSKSQREEAVRKTVLFIKCNEKFLGHQEQTLFKLQDWTVKSLPDLKVEFTLFFVKAISGPLLEQIQIERTEIIREATEVAENIIKDAIKLAEDKVQQSKKEEELLLKKIKTLKRELKDSRDTEILCTDPRTQEIVKITTHFNLLNKIDYFKNCFDRWLVKDANSPHPFTFDFTQFTPKTIKILLNYLEKPSSLKHWSDRELWEFYPLGDFFGDDEIKKKCLYNIVDWKDELLLDILSTSDLHTQDPLIQKACKKLAHRFTKIADHIGFVEIKHEYLLEVIKQEELDVLQETEVFKNLMKWVFFRSKTDNIAEAQLLKQPVGNTCLMEQIRFEHFRKKDIKKIIDSPYFSDEDKLRIVNLHLTKYDSLGRPDRIENRSKIDTKNKTFTWYLPEEKSGSA